MNAMDAERTIEAVRGIMSSLFASQRALRALAPEYKWTGLGNLLGDFGEFIGCEQYQLQKATGGADGYDAKTRDGRTVQIKTNHSASQIGFRGDADLVLVLHVRLDGESEEVYFGPFAPVKAASRYSARDNKQMIAVSKLRAMATALKASGPDAALSVGMALPEESVAGSEEE